MEILRESQYFGSFLDYVKGNNSRQNSNFSDIWHTSRYYSPSVFSFFDIYRKTNKLADIGRYWQFSEKYRRPSWITKKPLPIMNSI